MPKPPEAARAAPRLWQQHMAKARMARPTAQRRRRRGVEALVKPVPAQTAAKPHAIPVGTGC